MIKQLKRVPVSVAALVMVLCIALGVVAGNKNALDSAIAKNGAGFTAVYDLTQQRANKAGNLLVLLNRNLPGDASIVALEEAIAVQKSVKKPAKLAEADRNLTFAAQTASEKLLASAKEEDKKLTTGVMDELTSVGKVLAREAMAYNEGVAEARRVYNALPTNFLLGGAPEAYK